MPFADDYTIPLPAMYIAGTDPAVTYTDGRVKAGRLWLDTSTGTIGTLKKRNAANDDWDTLINLDGAPPADHATEHQNGGGDEIDVTGLSGVLADPQIADKVKESSGPTTLTVGAVADGEVLKRSGGTIIGAAVGGGGVGDVVGPGAATDNALARFDTTTGKLIQDSAITLDDTGAITVPEMAPPSTPASGKVSVYAKSDGKLYIKDDAGTETDLTATGTGTIAGSTGSTDNALLRADGAGGSTVQSSAVTVDDDGAITLPEIAAPGTPAAGKVVIYAKSDNKVYRKGEDGTEAELGGGGGGTNPTSDTLPYNNAGSFADSPIARLDAATVRAEVFHAAATTDVNTNGVISGRGTGLVVGRDLQFGLQNGSGTLDALISKPNTRHSGLLSVRRDTSGNGATFAYPPDSPAQITANQNDYSLGTNRSKYIRLTSNGVWDVTGLTIPSDGLGNTQVAGQEHVLVNVGANGIILKHQSASSSAANRFLCSTGADITLNANEAADIFYDATTQRWRVFKR